MAHDKELLRRLAAFPPQPFEGKVYRVTSLSRDALEATAHGGRWGLPQNSTLGTSVLYTSFHRNGALAEVASYFVQLTPLPRSNPVKVSTIELTASKVVELSLSEIQTLGVDLSRYGTRDYFLTQKIGAAIEFLGFDGLIAPSARFSDKNLMIFTTQHGFAEKLEVISSEEVEWRDWARKQGMLKGLE